MPNTNPKPKIEPQSVQSPRRVRAGRNPVCTHSALSVASVVASMPVPGTNGPIDEMIAKTPDWRGAALAKFRKVTRAADPAIIEEVKWRRPSNPMGVAVWEHNGIVCFGGILKERVRLTFFAGASLPDPQRLFNAMLNGKSRAIDVYEGDKLNEPALKALIRAGVEHNLAKVTPAKARKK
jgi:hypothetical protein